MAKNKTGKKIKCWLCGSWQDERYVEEVDFDSMPERICINCKSLIETREDSLEQRIIESEVYQRDVSPDICEEAEAEEVDKDTVPAKESYLP